MDFDRNLDPSLLDEIGPWSERKFGIVQEYATVYSTIMANAKARLSRFDHDYIDAYASAGFSRRKGTNDLVKGTALRSLEIEPPFKHYTFVELRADRYAMLKAHVMSRDDVSVLNSDANAVLPSRVFPQYTFSNYRRAFCLLDPYTHKQLDWSTIEAAGRNGAIDLLLHFPTMPMNRGALHRDGDVSPEEAAAMTRFWGDESWREAVYVRDGLFANVATKATDLAFATAFCERLKTVAGFKDTSKPIPMLNTRGATMYYLIFALPHPTAVRAAKSVAQYFIQHPSAAGKTRGSEVGMQASLN